MPPTNGSQPAPVRARSGTRGTSPEVIKQIQQYGQALSAPQIRKRLLSDGICTNETVPSDSTINKYKKQRSQDGQQRSTGQRVQTL